VVQLKLHISICIDRYAQVLGLCPFKKNGFEGQLEWTHNFSPAALLKLNLHIYEQDNIDQGYKIMFIPGIRKIKFAPLDMANYYASFPGHYSSQLSQLASH
jgi:hypothetical protein